MITSEEVYRLWDVVMPGWECHLMDWEIYELQRQDPKERGEALECRAQKLSEGLEAFKSHRSVCRLFSKYFCPLALPKVLHESPLSGEFRLCEDYVRAAGQAWRWCNSPYLHREKWLKIFRQRGKMIRHIWMTQKEKHKLHSLRHNHSILVWRAYQLPYAENGLSWSLSKSVAISIAQVRYKNQGQPMLLTGIVDAKHIVAYMNHMRRQEVIINSSNVEIVQNTMLNPPSVDRGLGGAQNSRWN